MVVSSSDLKQHNSVNSHITCIKVFIFRSSRPEVFCKKGAPRNFTQFTGKRLCQRLFLIKLQATGNVGYNFVHKYIHANQK